MKTLAFVAIVLISGASAGLIHGAVNMLLVEPYLDSATEIENQSLFASGLAQDTAEFRAEYEGYRSWQKSGMILGTVVLGISIGSLFGIVFALSRNSLPGQSDVKKSFALAGIMWFALFVVPFLKYPANPPTIGEADTLALRTALYVSFVIISGLGAVCFYKLSKILPSGKKILALAGYAMLISVAFAVMPENPDKITVHADLITGFRIMSMLGITSFWVSVGVFLGLFWSRLDPYKGTPRTYN
ncbi:MAG: hypothetical protein D9C04_01100 [Nitrosopumilus sp. B06]|nr:MAG: hypothetical protein D9C04_01100 [Nitrosopumilus sp. B06]